MIGKFKNLQNILLLQNSLTAHIFNFQVLTIWEKDMCDHSVGEIDAHKEEQMRMTRETLTMMHANHLPLLDT